LLLGKTGPTENFAIAFAELQGIKGTILSELGFDIRKGTHCGAGAPRFNATFEDGSFLFLGGCANMLTTSTGLYGERKRLSAADAAAVAGKRLASLVIVFDEGQNTATPGEAGNGLAVLDNITVNGVIVGRGPQK